MKVCVAVGSQWDTSWGRTRQPSTEDTCCIYLRCLDLGDTLVDVLNDRLEQAGIDGQRWGFVPVVGWRESQEEEAMSEMVSRDSTKR